MSTRARMTIRKRSSQLLHGPPFMTQSIFQESQSSLNFIQTHDNGGRPFQVRVDRQKNVVVVHKGEFKNNVRIYNQVILETSFQRIFTGGPLPKQYYQLYYDFQDGNSVLLHTQADEYIYVGESIFKFQSPKPITQYISPIGNNDVPYPFAQSQNETFLLVQGVILDNQVLKQQEAKQTGKVVSPYHIYYGVHKTNCPKPIVRRPLETILIQQRIF